MMYIYMLKLIESNITMTQLIKVIHKKCTISEGKIGRGNILSTYIYILFIIQIQTTIPLKSRRRPIHNNYSTIIKIIKSLKSSS